MNSMQKRMFEAGRRDAIKDGGIIQRGGSINDDISRSLSTLVRRSRHLSQNNSYVKRGITTIVNHSVGKGIIPQVTSKKKEKFEKYLKIWADSIDIDAERRHDLYGLQQLVLTTVLESGECLIRKRIRPKEFGLKVPLQLQLLDADFLDTSKGNLGIEFDRYGRRVAYWLFKENPINLVFGGSSESIKVPASDIIHCYRSHRSGQIRGFPETASIILRAKDLDEYESAQLIKQKIAACLVGFVSEEDSGTYEKRGDLLNDLMELVPGRLQYLEPGQKIEFSNPPQISNYSDYIDKQLQAISAGLGVPAFLLANDYSKINFSSANMAFSDFFMNNAKYVHFMLIPQFCQEIFKWFVEVLNLTGLARGDAQCVWVPPKREYPNPIQKIKADELEVACGFESHSEKIRERGKDPYDVRNEIEADNKEIDKRGFVFKTDLRQEKKEKVESKA